MGLQSKLIYVAHRGHTGITETLNKLRLRGYFPGMSDQVTLVVSNCIQCLQKSNQVPLSKGKPMHREVLSYPMQRVYIDTVGPLTPSRINGKIMKHIFTILDGFTRYLTAIPIPDLESTTLLNTFIEGFCLKFGLPEVVHSDNRSSLLNKQFQDSLHQLGIKTTQTPVYSPEGNRVERSHRTLGASLRSDDSTSPGWWPIKLNTILFELNNARNRVTGVSLYFGIFGRNPQLPLDVCFPSQNFQKIP